LREDSWTEWSAPVNLGKGLNSVEDDWGYKITTDGRYAYLAQAGVKGGQGGFDLVRVELPADLRPSPVATVRGRIRSRSGEPLPAKLLYENLTEMSIAGELAAKPDDGSYFIALPLGKHFGYTANLEKYFPVSQHLDLRNRTASLDTVIDITLDRIDELRTQRGSIRLNNLFFDTDKADLKPESYPELNRLVQLLLAQPDARIEIAGHTDNVGGDAYNKSLSERRARAVVQYLVQKGIASARLVPLGLGLSQPVASNTTPEGRALNRRVEVRFLN
jgi:outer membrane protein OmpA-like peptidoglycan-associated protein